MISNNIQRENVLLKAVQYKFKYFYTITQRYVIKG